MSSSIKQQSTSAHWLIVTFCCLLLPCLNGCAGAASTPATGPRAGEPPYPLLMTEDPDRRAATLAAWTGLAHAQGLTNPPAPELQPVTATLRSIPTMSPALSLPKVGAGPEMSEEELRESLRRFISAQSSLLGATPQQLSLVLRTDQADGTKKAEYRQRPFRFPLRGGYGLLEITFTPDLRIQQINSTCIPDTERMIRAAVAAGFSIPRYTEEIIQRISGHTLTYTDAAGTTQTLTVSPNEVIKVSEMVVYPRQRAGTPAALEFHLAWEVKIGPDASARTIYLDAVNNEILALNS